uniref:Uncharacterized protein n=1 Tax=Sphaeramia orbicularis TaxID=375764 RepID=A0A672ZD39_9TELE
MAVQETASQLSMALKVQEYPTLKVPYETLNKRFRAAQKNIDRETSHVTMVVAELEKTLSSFPVVDSVVSLLDGVVEKLSALKRKVRTNMHSYTPTKCLINETNSMNLSRVNKISENLSQSQLTI